MCVSKSFRSFIAQLRSGVLPLKVEGGRFSQKKLEERICEICNDGVEDELHFIFNCPEYKYLRIDFFNYVAKFHDIHSMSVCDKLKVFMNDKRLIHKFGAFIRNCFYKRNDKLFNSVS